MTTTRNRQVPNVNDFLVWRREFYEEPANLLIAATNPPGSLISTSYTVTLDEDSYIRIVGKAHNAPVEDSTSYWLQLYIYEGAGGSTAVRDYNFATSIDTGSIPDDTRNGCSVQYEGLYAAGDYVFELRGRAPITNKVTANLPKWWIDVARG